MIKFNYITKEKVKEHNPNWPQNPDHPYRILIIAIYGLEKTNSFINQILIKVICMLGIHM